MKQVEVTILGQGYMLGCPEGGEALLRRPWPASTAR
jgi:cell division protein ZapA